MPARPRVASQTYRLRWSSFCGAGRPSAKERAKSGWAWRLNFSLNTARGFRRKGHSTADTLRLLLRPCRCQRLQPCRELAPGFACAFRDPCRAAAASARPPTHTRHGSFGLVPLSPAQNRQVLSGVRNGPRFREETTGRWATRHDELERVWRLLRWAATWRRRRRRRRSEGSRRQGEDRAARWLLAANAGRQARPEHTGPHCVQPRTVARQLAGQLAGRRQLARRKLAWRAV
jgi:hypothetical protein